MGNYPCSLLFGLEIFLMSWWMTLNVVKQSSRYAENWLGPVCRRIFYAVNSILSNFPFTSLCGERQWELVYVIAWARGQLRINFTRIFKVFTKLPESRSDEGNLENLKIQVKLILNCPRALAITCLSHTGQNSVHRTTFKVLPSRKQVCRSSKKNQLAVERRKPAMVVAKHSKFNSPEAIYLQTKLQAM